MTQAKINPLILRWARACLGLTEQEVARKVGLGEKVQRLQAWEQGQEAPTFRQAQMLARVLQIPFGYLFLSNPPATTIPVTDFRTVPEAERGRFSPELEDVLNDALRKRDWLRERRLQEGRPPLPFIGRFSGQDAPEKVSEAIRDTLGLPVPTARDVKSEEEHLRFLVRQAEHAGIMVLQSGYALSNTHRTLSVREFRGFALVDAYAPLIFLNSKDSIHGRIFTLAHELGHLWTGASGISNPEATLPKKATPEIERLCNRIAAELLVPAALFIERWGQRPPDPVVFHGLAGEFRVSVFVILIRGYELGLLPKQAFQDAYESAWQDVQASFEEKPESSGGGDFYRTLQTRTGRLLLGEVAEALREGSVLYKEASGLLNIKPKTVDDALQEF